MIKLHEMVRVRHPEGEVTIVPELHFKESYYPGATFEYAPEATGLELAAIIDADLENANYHSMVGLAGELYAIVKDVADEDKANLFMDRIYDKSLFQNMY